VTIAAADKSVLVANRIAMSI